MNWIRYIDCMDEEKGLPSLPDNSIDLCMTDPPYNVKAKAYSQRRRHDKMHKGKAFNVKLKNNKINYQDDVEDYSNWCESWFRELQRICNKIIFTPGYQNIGLWYSIEKPRDILYHIKRNGSGLTSITWHNRIEMIFVYGDFNGLKKPFLENIFDIPLSSGFMRKNEFRGIHPHPKPWRLWLKIIKDINPKNVLDPFMGSGTSAEVCERLGIPYCGYEKEIKYKVDIDKRIDRGIRSKQVGQKLLNSYMEKDKWV